MKLTRFTSATEFYARAEPFLVAREAHHNLPLGICTYLIRQPDLFPEPPYLALVEDGGEIAAAAVRTPPWRLVLSTAQNVAALNLIAEDLAVDHAQLPGATGPKPVSLQFSEIWHGLKRQPFRLKMAQRIYQLERVIPPPPAPGRLRRAVPEDRDRMVDWIHAFSKEALDEVDRAEIEKRLDSYFDSEVRGLFFWEDQKPVSMVGFAGPTPNGIRIGPVYTPPELRRRGYASACVAALSQQLLDGGRKYCFLFTDLANPTSNRIYQAIGYAPVVDVDEYAFEAAP